MRLERRMFTKAQINTAKSNVLFLLLFLFLITLETAEKKSSEQVAVSTATTVAKINPQITAVTTIQNGAFTQKYS